VQGTFSLAVTDDTQVQTDSIGNNIVSSLLLTSDLKGSIQSPGYYLQSDEPKVWRDLDNLLLTQGWVGYNWKDVFSTPEIPLYSFEGEFTVKGRITNVFNKPVANTGVALLSKKPAFVMDTLTNESGNFTFNNLFPVDTAIFIIQARNKGGNSFNVGVSVDEFKPPVFAKSEERLVPWYVINDTTRLQHITNNIMSAQEQQRHLSGGIGLQEVIITAKKMVKGSKNLNGPGEAALVLDEEDMKHAGKTSLNTILEQNIKGFWQKRNKEGVRLFRVNDKLVHLIIDGINVDDITPPNVQFKDNYLKDYLEYYTAEEIKGIEVIGFNNIKYFSQFIDPGSAPSGHDFIEITTRSGLGPFLKKTPGGYLYKPLPLSISKTFYRPRYAIKQKNEVSDLRSIIHWEPEIVTDADGQAVMTFYATDRAKSYTIIIEGSDMNGNIGFKRQKLPMKP